MTSFGFGSGNASCSPTDPLNGAHLAELTRLERDFNPVLVSEHLAWASVDGRFMNDLLPLPYTAEALRHMASRVSEVQDVLGRQILIENVSSYLEFKYSQMTEWEFLAALAAESGCGILFDVNNLYVNAINHGFEKVERLEGNVGLIVFNMFFPAEYAGET